MHAMNSATPRPSQSPLFVPAPLLPSHTPRRPRAQLQSSYASAVLAALALLLPLPARAAPPQSSVQIATRAVPRGRGAALRVVAGGPERTNAALLIIEPCVEDQCMDDSHGQAWDTMEVAPPEASSQSEVGALSVRPPAPAQSRAPSFPPPSQIPERVATGSAVQRALYAVERAPRPRSRVRPATVGLVGFGAFSSGSALLRTVAAKARRKVGSRFGTDGRNGAGESIVDGESCTVAFMQIPFCVPVRGQMLQSLRELASSSDLSSAGGLAFAARKSASLLLAEPGLLKDSECFAPHIDVYIAESLEDAKRRFSGHVSTEESHMSRAVSMQNGTKHQASPDPDNAGSYGIVTMVVATKPGVDLHCYGVQEPNVQCLRSALSSVTALGEKDVAGLELVWLPDEEISQPLSRMQLADVFPSLGMS